MFVKTHCKRGHPRTSENVSNAGQCKACAVLYRQEHPEQKPTAEKMRGYRKVWREKNPDYHKFHWLKRKYDMSREEYEARLKEQKHRCKICQCLVTEPEVDHDHATGQNRDLLCGPCNRGLGQFKDDPLIVAAALEYLKGWSTCLA